MRLVRPLMLSAIFASSITIAQAADILRGTILPPAAPLPVEAENTWTGVYVGAQVGYSWGRDRTTEFFTANGAYTGFSWRYKADSALAGVHAGALYEAQRVVVGIEGEFEAVNARGGFTDPIGAGKMTNNWRASIRGKAGYSFGRVLPFVTFGAAFLNMKYDYTNFVGPVVESTHSVRTGYTIGAGVSYAVTRNVMAGIEYRFTDLGNFFYDSRTAFPGLTGRQNPRFSTLRTSVSYKF